MERILNVKCNVSPETCAGSCRADSLSVIHGCNSASLTNFVVWGACSWRHTSLLLSLNLFSKLYFLEPSRKWCAAGTVHASIPGRAKNVQESPWSTRAARKYLSRERKRLRHAFCNHVAIPLFGLSVSRWRALKKSRPLFFTCSNGPGVYSAVQLVSATHCSSISIICRKCLNKSMFACHCNVVTAVINQQQKQPSVTLWFVPTDELDASYLCALPQTAASKQDRLIIRRRWSNYTESTLFAARTHGPMWSRNWAGILFFFFDSYAS